MVKIIKEELSFEKDKTIKTLTENNTALTLRVKL